MVWVPECIPTRSVNISTCLGASDQARDSRAHSHRVCNLAWERIWISGDSEYSWRVKEKSMIHCYVACHVDPSMKCGVKFANLQTETLSRWDLGRRWLRLPRSSSLHQVFRGKQLLCCPSTTDSSPAGPTRNSANALAGARHLQAFFPVLKFPFPRSYG